LAGHLPNGNRDAPWLARYVEDTAIASVGAECNAAAFSVPCHRGDAALAGAAKQDFLLVRHAGCHDHAVYITDGEDFVGGVEGDSRDHRIATRAEFQRGLADRAVLALERPDDGGRRAGACQPAALGTPG